MNLELNSSISHKFSLINQDDNLDLIDSILDGVLYEFPIKNIDELLLIDNDTKNIIRRFININEINLGEYPIEELLLRDVNPNHLDSFNIPLSLTTLAIQGGNYMYNLMSNNETSKDLWMKVMYLTNKSLFQNTIDERIENESELRYIFNNELRELNVSSEMNLLGEKISKTNIHSLTISWVYLNDEDLKNLAICEKIESLTFQYIYNDNIHILPPNLKYLSIFGSTLENLAGINFRNINLNELNLEGNCIKDLTNLKKLPKTLFNLNLDQNLITTFKIEDLPSNLVTLSLDRNLIGNSIFDDINEDVVNTTIKKLILSNNQLNVNHWLLNRITEIFPMLEYLELSGNIIEGGVPENILINDEESSCLEKVRHYFEETDYLHMDSYEDLAKSFNFYSNKNVISIKWEHKTLTANVILSSLQYEFNNYLKEMPQFKLFTNGLYCDIEHSQIAVLIKANIEDAENSISLSLYAENRMSFYNFFYKYFNLVYQTVEITTHHNILPKFSFTRGCEIFNTFYEDIFKFKDKIRGVSIMLTNDANPLLIVRNLKKGHLEKNQEEKKKIYKAIKNIVFVIITGKNAFAFMKDSHDTICNVEEENNKFKETEYFDFSLRTSEEKQIYINSITNKFLGNFSLEEGFLFSNNDVTQKISIYFNPEYIYKNDSGFLHLKSNLSLNLKNIQSPKVGNRKLHLKLNENQLTAFYRVK